MIIAFAYFYNSIAFDPIRQADQIRRQGGFIPGVRPGPQTERHLRWAVNRITLPGVPCSSRDRDHAVPGSCGCSTSRASFTYRQKRSPSASGWFSSARIDGQLMMRNYEGFLK